MHPIPGSVFEHCTPPKSGIRIAFGGDALRLPPTGNIRLSGDLRNGSWGSRHVNKRVPVPVSDIPDQGFDPGRVKGGDDSQAS